MDLLSPFKVNLNDEIVTPTLDMLKISFPEMNMDRHQRVRVQCQFLRVA